MTVGRVAAVARDGKHRFSKTLVESIELVAGYGIRGDAHAGDRVQHRSRVRADPTAPNLRQVHLMPTEVLDALVTEGYDVSPGQLGENVTTTGIDLLGLSRGTLLRLGADAVVEVTGLRNPCGQIEAFRTGLLQRVIQRDAAGGLIGRAGVMGIVVAGGRVDPGDGIVASAPGGPHVQLRRV